MNVLARLGQIALVLSVLLAATACGFAGIDWDCSSHGCHSVATRTYDFKDFDSIQIQNAFNVTVQPAQEFRVSVTVAESTVPDLDVRQEGKRLVIGVRGNSCSCRDRRAVVTLPILRRVDAKDASQATLQGHLSSEKLELYFSDASKVMGDGTADATVLHLSDASDADLSGTTGRLELEVVDGSNARLRNLAARQADVVLRDGSSAFVSVADRLDVTASGGSSLRYAGEPVLGRTDVSGGSSLEREK